jgi:hypothetical protein
MTEFHNRLQTCRTFARVAVGLWLDIEDHVYRKDANI